MSKFESCDKCKHNAKTGDEFPCNGCIHNAEDHYEPMTNADRIRHMTDEELAEFLESYEVCNHCEYHINKRCTLDNPCVHAFAQAMAQKWLQAEVEEGAE